MFRGTLLQREDEAGEGAYLEDSEDRGQSPVDLRKVGGVDLDFFFYYSIGMGEEFGAGSG